MANNHATLVSLFGDIANSIRSKTGDTNTIVADNFPDAISSITTQNTSDANALANEILAPKTAYIATGKVTGTMPTRTADNVIVSGRTITTNAGYYASDVSKSVSNGAINAIVTTHTNTSPSVTVSHSGNIATIGTTTKPSGTAGTDFYQIGFTNSVTAGNTNVQSYANVTTVGYVTTANNIASSWTNKPISASVTQPATYYIPKGTLVEGNISGTAFLENTGDYGFRATVEVPAGYHTGETVIKNFTTGIFPAPESKATADKMLTGYSLYDEDGKLITGTMPNQGSQTSTIGTQGGTYTIPEGYHDGSGVITASIGAGDFSAAKITNVSVTPSVTGTVTTIASTTKPSGTDGTDYYTINPDASYTNGNARAKIDTAGYLSTGSKYINVPASVSDGTNYYITKSTSTNSSSVSGGTVTATVTIPAGYNPGETVVVSNDVSTATHPNPSINKATLNTTSGNVEITANHVQSTGYVTGGTTSASTNVQIGLGTVSGSLNTTSGNVEVTKTAGYIAAGTTNVSVGLGEINTPSATKAQSTPTFSWDATNRKLTASVAATSATVYANTKTAGYVPTATRSGTVTMSASSNSYTIDAAAINAPSGSAKQSKPGLSFNASNGVVTATVAATSGTAYANVTGAGYVGTGTKSGTFTMTAADRNTISIGLGVVNTPSGSKTLDKPSISFDDVNAVITATVADTTIVAHANTKTAGYVPTATRNAALTITGNSDSYSIGLASINAPSGSKAQSTPAITVYANGLISATSAATSGTAYANVATAGYTAAGTKSGTFTLSASSAGTKQLSTKAGGTTTITGNTKIVSNQTFTTGDVYATVTAGAINTPSGTGSATISSATIAYDSTNGVYGVSGSASITGTAYRNVTTAGYLATNTTSGSVSGTASLATTLPKAGVTANILNSAGGSITTSRTPVLRYGGVPSGTVNAAGGDITTTAPSSGPYITVNTPANTASAYAYVSGLTAGYTDGTAANTTVAYNSKACGAAAMADRYIPIKVGTVTNTQGTASGATVTGSVNITQGWVEAQNISISGTVASGSATTPAKTVYTAAPTATINQNNGLITVAAKSGTLSVTPTVSAGYVSSGTAGTITATYNGTTLQLTTKTGAGSNYQNNLYITPYTNGTAQTIMNRNEYLVANHIIVNGVSAGSATTPATTVYTAAPSVTITNSNGYVTVAKATGTKSVTPTVSAGYVSAGTAGTITATVNATGLQLNTKAGGTTTVTSSTAVTLINAGQFAIGDIKANVNAGVLSAGTAAVLNNSNGNIRYYRNVSTAGYIAANTTAYYLQLNTKAGSSTGVNATEVTLINAGQFAVGAIKAKAQAATFNTTTCALDYPGGIITTS